MSLSFPAEVIPISLFRFIHVYGCTIVKKKNPFNKFPPDGVPGGQMETFGG